MERINEFLEHYKWPLLLSIVGIVLLIGGTLSSGVISRPRIYPKASLVNNKTPQTIKIDISGAVQNPGVYSLQEQSRIEDAIKSAGGFSASASAEYVSKILNLSQKLSDGQKIYVPFDGENVANLSQGGLRSNIVGLNSGSLVELDRLPGIGLTTAQKIIDHRPYQSLDELVNKKVIPRSTFDKIKELVDLN